MTSVWANTSRCWCRHNPLLFWELLAKEHISRDSMELTCFLDHGGRLLMGNFHEDSFLDAPQSEKFQYLRN